MKYPKIETLFDRDPKTFKVTPVIRESIKALWMIRPEFLLWTEKLNGTNFQVKMFSSIGSPLLTPEERGKTYWDERCRLLPGKRNGTINPNDLGDWIYGEVFTMWKGALMQFRDALVAKTNENALPATLFGEIIGDSVQKGGRLYAGENIRRVHFFDLCLASGNFVDWDFLQDLLSEADLLGVVETSESGWRYSANGYGFPHNFTELNYGDIKDFFGPAPLSQLGEAPLEGFVIRPTRELRDGFGHRLIGKIKGKDFPRVK